MAWPFRIFLIIIGHVIFRNFSTGLISRILPSGHGWRCPRPNTLSVPSHALVCHLCLLLLLCPLSHTRLRSGRNSGCTLALENRPLTLPYIATTCLSRHVLTSPSETWFEKGIITFEDLYSRGTLSSFSDLSQRFNLPKSHLFRYFQIRHFLQKQSPEFPNQPIHSEIDSILSLDPNAKGLISNIHTEIDSVRPEPVATLKLAWERDLGLELTEVVWGRVLGLVHMSSICARHSLIQCKIVHRIHYTNARLARIFPGTSDACNRCKQSPADLIHMFWTCPHLSEFWTSIFTSFNSWRGYPT